MMWRKFLFSALAGAICLWVNADDAKYNIAEPYKTKALNPVKLSERSDLKPLVIASKGKAEVPIVCSDTAYYRQIANLLKTYLDKMSGAGFVITDKVPKDGRAIFVGPNDLASVKAVFDKAQSMPAESLVIESIPEGIVLVGKDAECENRLITKNGLNINDRNQSRGTFFATVDFLERLAGVRFYFPGIGIHVPDYAQKDIVIPSVSYSDTPVFEMRALGYGGGSDVKLIKSSRPEDNRFWNTLLRLGDVTLKMGWHNDAHWHLVYGKTHPEYFALREDGTRAVGDRGRYSSYRCYSSIDGLNAHTNAIDQWYKGGYKTNEGSSLFLAERREFGPNKKYINWGIADAFRGCYCEKCLALTDKNTPGGLYSKFVWRYFIDLAKECKKRWPDKIVMNMLYGNYKAIPDFVYKENPGNLIIFPCSHGVMGHSAAFLKEPEVFKASKENLEKLRSLSCGKPHIWEHYPHVPRSKGFTIPYMTPHYYQKFIMENKETISGALFNGDGRYSYALDSLMLYMMYKIYWNPDFNVDACLDEYCPVMFGPAAKEISDYYKTLIDRWENVKWKDLPDPRKTNFSALPKKVYFVDTYPREVRDNLEKMLRQALAQTSKGSIYYDRVKFLIDGTAPFFEQGRFFDLGKEYKYSCPQWTPDNKKGLRVDRPAGIRSLSLASNDTGKPSDDIKAQIFMSYDDKNLYISGKIEQKDAFVTKGEGKKVERDSDIWAKDSLEIFICSEQPGLEEAGLDQKSQYHQLIIDPDGSIFDGCKEAETAFNIGANLKFESKTIACTKPNRFYFDLVIPFSELKCIPPKAGSKWYINFYWNHSREGKQDSFTWAGTGGHHDTSRFGIVEFGQTEKPKKD